ncbi:hypothetical protein [Thiorhodococcus minor]|uniref:Uncharacterized protein n=1 Tax=Thiorhodococcus minor TaxID=57489 RepID=A0A6M0K5Q7_9GAMM|nr:hypothetical protein [Thiorhodococcus minor]NEV65108.1 hypothetical protein [Thiorhodococcus minor]
MDTGTAKAIEVIVIGALFVGFYLQQQKSLTRTKSDDSDARREARRSAASETSRQGSKSSEPSQGDDHTG